MHNVKIISVTFTSPEVISDAKIINMSTVMLSGDKWNKVWKNLCRIVIFYLGNHCFVKVNSDSMHIKIMNGKEEEMVFSTLEKIILGFDSFFKEKETTYVQRNSYFAVST